MKKIISAIAAAGIMMCSMPFNAVAAEKAVPAEIDKYIYDQFMDISWKYDLNSDGVFTQEELEKVREVSLRIEDGADLSWLADMKNCEYLGLSGGDMTEIPELKEMPSLRRLSLGCKNITDISFVKELNLTNCEIGMKDVTLEQRLAVMNCVDVTVEEGYEEVGGAYPKEILFGHDTRIVIDDESIAEFGEISSVRGDCIRGIYGVSAGETDYHIYVDDVERFTGHITVEPMKSENRELRDTEGELDFHNSVYYSPFLMIDHGDMYGFTGKEMQLLDTGVKDFMYASSKAKNNQSYSTEMLLKEDGTLYFNKNEIEGQKFSRLENSAAITEDGQMWVTYTVDHKPGLYKIADDYQSCPYDQRHYYISKTGEVVWYSVSFEGDEPVIQVKKTGIMNPKWVGYDMFVDENDVLWSNFGSDYEYSMMERAQNVIDVDDYYDTEGKMVRGYRTLDGKYYSLGGNKEFTPGEKPDWSKTYKEYHILKRDYYEPAEENIWTHITADDKLTIDYKDDHHAINGVKKVVRLLTDKDAGKTYIYFQRLDDTLWYFCLEDQEFSEIYIPGGEKPAEATGDANGDGELTVADAVVLQKWLLDGTSELKDWKAADLTGDGVLNVYDLCLMRRKLTE